MKICVFLPDLSGGGAEKVFLAICDSLVTEGYLVDLVVMNAIGDYLNDIPSKIRLVDLKCPKLWSSLPAFMSYLRKEQPDSILSAISLANGIAGWALRFSGIKSRLILTEHNPKSLTFGYVNAVYYRFVPYLIRPSYGFADEIIAVSEGVAKRVRSLSQVDASHVHVVYNPIYTPSIKVKAAESVAHAWFSDREIPIILSAGRLVSVKDYPSLIRAFDLVRRERAARLMILGQGEKLGELLHLVDNLGLRDLVTFPGFVRNPYAYMAKASVFVLSSEHEGFGNVLVEAMACGTPVISTDCPSGPHEILAGGHYGPLVTVGDVFALAEGIISLLDNPTTPEKLIKRAKFFSHEVAAKRYIELLTGFPELY